MYYQLNIFINFSGKKSFVWSENTSVIKNKLFCNIYKYQIIISYTCYLSIMLQGKGIFFPNTLLCFSWVSDIIFQILWHFNNDLRYLLWWCLESIWVEKCANFQHTAADFFNFSLCQQIVCDCFGDEVCGARLHYSLKFILAIIEQRCSLCGKTVCNMPFCCINSL